MTHCRLCHAPIRKLLGHESDPDELSCWTHVEGGYVCRGARSEFDLATFDPEEQLETVSAAPLDVPEDYSI